MLSAKDAAVAAIKYFKDVYGEQYINVKLEEAELTENGFWEITLGFDEVHPLSALTGSLSLPGKRDYKIFRINSEGNVVSMKIRKVS
jgi:hypothetical protein